MYRNHADIIAFKQFALEEIEKLPPQEIDENKNLERNYHVLNSVDFERRLLIKQLQLLDRIMTEASAFFYSFSEYLNNLRSQLKMDYIDRRIKSNK